MPPHGEDAESRQSEQAGEHGARGPDCAFYAVRQKPREQSHQALAARPVRVVGWEDRTNRDGDAIGNEEDETRAEHGCSAPRQRAEAFKRGERPADAEEGQDDRPHAEQLPQRVADRPSPASRQRRRQQRQPQEKPHQQGGDADELPASFGIHAAMRRSA